MEHNICEESGQNTSDVEYKKTLSDVEKSNSSEPKAIESMKIDEKWSTENNLASPTPQKTVQLPRSKNRGNALQVRSIKQICKDFQNEDVVISEDESTINNNNIAISVSDISDSSPYAVDKSRKHEENKLPDKYKIIADFFGRMMSSLRLLNLRGKLSSFQNICIQVEILTKRRFLYSHLAQIKYLFPEVIQIDKILTHDERTLCMKPEMKITLLAGEFQGHPGQSGSMTLHKVFRQRLLDFFSAHPEGGDIPEASLPEPFDKRSDSILLKPLPLGSFAELPQQTLVEFESFTNSCPSHLCPSFCRQFSQKIVPETVKTPLLDLPVPLLSVTTGSERDHDIKSPIKKESTSANTESPAKLKITPNLCRNPNYSESTPFKPSPFSTPIKLTETPAQPTPKRSMPSPGDDLTMETESLSHSAPRRALIFSSPSEPDENDARPIVPVIEKDGGMSDTSIQVAVPKGTHVEEEIMRSTTILQSVHDRTGLSKRQQMLACLPGLFNTILLIFQSAHRSSVTKQELVQKIIWQSFDIVETKEVEEQLKLLEELVPDWICGKIVSSGDFLYCLRKSSDPKSALERLVKAT